MKTLYMLPVECLSGRAGRLLDLAIENGWTALPGEGRAWSIRDSGVCGVVLPEAFPNAHAWPETRYSDQIDLNGFGTLALSPTGLIIRNLRYVPGDDQAALCAAETFSKADVVAVTALKAGGAYRERLLTARSGEVFGFKRSYHSDVIPAAFTSRWPYAVILSARAVSALAAAPVVPADFGAFVDSVKKRGLSVVSVGASIPHCDIGSDAGLLDRFTRLCESRDTGNDRLGQREMSSSVFVKGPVITGDAVSVEAGAALLGPCFLGRGARVGAGSVVRSSIVGPGVEMPSDSVIRDAVLLKGDSIGPVMRRAPSHPDMVCAAPDGAFRKWPVFSYANLGKRILDIAGSIVALLVLATIFPIVAIAIKLNSRGPVFYAHTRQGLHGREFKCLKFRTMVAGAEQAKEELRVINEVDGPQFKIEGDPRITLVGDFLRSTNIDEVPQFLNVLAGQMSIVGPRPSPDEENQICPSWREARLSVRPGITGLWQVERSESRANDFQEWIYYDTQYVRDLSFRLDAAIILKTVVVILRAFAQLFVAKREGDLAVR